MREEVSALVDGELDEDAVEGSLRQLRVEGECREAWDTYHLIGDALRGHLAPGVAARVSARLAEEPAVLSPRARRPAARAVRWTMSAAAGVAAVALVAWMSLPLFQAEQPQIAQAPTGGVQDYLQAHQIYSVSSTVQGMAPYARLVSMEQDGDRR